MADPNRLVDQCVHKGLMYMAESLQYYWPANYPNENNIALHLARSFAEKGFQVWAEIPLKKNKKERLDFLSNSYPEEITVVMEFKGGVEDPPANIADLKRLVDIHNNNEWLYNDWPAAGSIQDHRIYGVVTLLYAMEFVNWWHTPDPHKDYMPDIESIADKNAQKRRAVGYKTIGKALGATHYRGVAMLEDFYRYDSARHSRYRFGYAAYALYDETSIKELEKALDAS